VSHLILSQIFVALTQNSSVNIVLGEHMVIGFIIVNKCPKLINKQLTIDDRSSSFINDEFSLRNINENC
jgi:hypothetical protein